MASEAAWSWFHISIDFVEEVACFFASDGPIVTQSHASRSITETLSETARAPSEY